MLNSQQHIVDLSEILFRKGVSYIVISPGSRNAPLMEALFSRFAERCISIVDERSAAYVGIGLARQSRKPVVLLCTSGTAVLNYSPALAEAYYQRIPILAITADRPAEWIDQQDNQTIRQQNVYSNFVKKSFHLAEDISQSDQLLSVHRTILEAYSISISGSPGPVHINVPLKEPLYIKQPLVSRNINLTHLTQQEEDFLPVESLKRDWEKAERILLIHGQDQGNTELQNIVLELSKDPRLVVVTENISNLFGDEFIAQPELILAKNEVKTLPTPDLLIYSGGQVVSKRLKKFLREISVPTWRIGEDTYPLDTFKQKNSTLNISPINVYKLLKRNQNSARSTFKHKWLSAHKKLIQQRSTCLSDIPYSDISVTKQLLDYIPEDTIVELGNSSIIRISQIFETNPSITYHSNRGVSGIDGCLSSAVGTALASNNLVVCILGDLSFLYDSNALWNRKFPRNLRIIILNNSGGGIFGLIPGPSSNTTFQDFLVAHHPVNIQKLAEAYNLNYFCTQSQLQLKEILPVFLLKEEGAGILEVKTNQETNREAFRQIMH